MRGVVREELSREVADIPEETHAEHVVGCKNCYPEVIKKARETMKFQCSNCGLPLREDMLHYTDNPCPNCGEDYNLENVEKIERE